MIVTANPTWKLTRRRARKFLKRYQRGIEDVSGADDDATEATDASSAIKKTRTKGLVGRVFRRSSRKPSFEAVPESTIPDEILTDSSADSADDTLPSPLAETPVNDPYRDDDAGADEKQDCSACFFLSIF